MCQVKVNSHYTHSEEYNMKTLSDIYASSAEGKLMTEKEFREKVGFADNEIPIEQVRFRDYAYDFLESINSKSKGNR